MKGNKLTCSISLLRTGRAVADVPVVQAVLLHIISDEDAQRPFPPTLEKKKKCLSFPYFVKALRCIYVQVSRE